MQNTTSSPTSLADAVESVLGYGGSKLLHDPKQFWGILTDCHDPELHTTEMEILSHYCNEELLKPLADACEPGSTGAEKRLEQAQRRMETILRDNHHIDGASAASLSRQLVQGAAQYLGVRVTTFRKLTATCAKCGTKLPEGDECCPKCGPGTQIEVRDEYGTLMRTFEGTGPELVYTKRCANCKRTFDMGVYACPHCGRGTIVEVIDQYGHASEWYDTTPPTPDPVPPNPPNPVPDPAPDPKPNPHDLLKKRLYLAIIAGSVIVLVLIGVLFVQGTGEKSTPSTSGTDSSPTTVSTSESDPEPEVGPSDPIERIDVDHVGTASGSIHGWDSESTAAGLIVTNRSGTTLHLEATFTYSTSSSSAQSVDYVQALGSGESALMVARYDGSANLVSYSIICEPSSVSNPGRESMAGMYEASKESQDKYGATVSVTNTDTTGKTIYVRTVSIVATDPNSHRTYVATRWLDGSQKATALAPGERGLVTFTDVDLYQAGAHPDWSTLSLGEYYVEGYVE